MEGSSALVAYWGQQSEFSVVVLGAAVSVSMKMQSCALRLSAMAPDERRVLIAVRWAYAWNAGLVRMGVRTCSGTRFFAAFK